MQEVEGRAKRAYEFGEAQEEVHKGKSVVIYNSGDSDKSITMKEENIYSAIQLNANVTSLFPSYAKDGSNVKPSSLSPAECALLSH